MIVEGGGDYLLQVKDNQPTLHAQVQTLVEEALWRISKGSAMTGIRRWTAVMAASRPAGCG